MKVILPSRVPRGIAIPAALPPRPSNWGGGGHQRLFGFETAQIVLRTLDHQVQICQWVTKCLLQGLQKLYSLLIHTEPLPLVAQL